MGHGSFKKHVVTEQQKPMGQPQEPLPRVPPVREKSIFWEDDNDVDFEDVTFVVPVVISVILLVVFVLRKYIRWSVPCPSQNRLYGKTVVITGGNTGIGRATATELAKRGGRIIIGCRDKKKGDAVVLQIRNKSQNPDVFCYRLDLASLSSIKDFADDFNRKEPTLHVLINNAAYMGPRATTEDGYEKAFGVNYLGHFYLTYLLSDKLKRAAPSRVINVISDSYTKAKLNFDDIPLAKYDIYGAYARSKLAMVVFNAELHRRLSSEIVHVYGVHPGMVSTDLLRNWPGITGNILRAWARVLFMTPDDGCQTIIFCAVADKMREFSGKVFENCNIYKIKSYARERDLGEKLWNVSLHLCGLDSEIPEPVMEPKEQTQPVVTAEGEKAKQQATANGEKAKAKQKVEEVGPTEAALKKEQ